MKGRLIVIGTIASVLAVVALLAGFMYFELMGWGGWEPGKHSVYEQRAHQIDSQLHLGMTQEKVNAIFRADIARHPADVSEDTENLDHNRYMPPGPFGTDLLIVEPRPHFWNSFDAGWDIEATFDKHQKLIHHAVSMSAVDGP